MALIRSISGIRGTIGGVVGDNLTPLDVVRYSAAFAAYCREHRAVCDIVVAHDARVSASIVEMLVCSTLQAMGCKVINIGLATTPTTELAVVAEGACGGIILTASHNPAEWNALKLLNERGEFLDEAEGAQVLRIAKAETFVFADIEHLATQEHKDYLPYHIAAVCALPLVDAAAIAQARFKVAVDGINSVGGVAIPALLRALGVQDILEINCEPTGRFAHTPEPIPANLMSTCQTVRDAGVDVAFVVDPDVDRLAIICEDGSLFGEEYTLVSVADYVLAHESGNTVSNLSSSRALHDVTVQHGGQYSASAVGEVNVVAEMRRTHAVIGGEGNGGVIYPACHYGRDALVGVALFLTHLAKKRCTVTQLRDALPQYHISKNKIALTPDIDVEHILESVKTHYKNERITDIDGVKIDFEAGWVHLRKSNTEPIIRIYSEARTEQEAQTLAQKVIAVATDAAAHK